MANVSLASAVAMTCRIRSSAPGVYEQVLREGNEDDVRFFIDVDGLVDLWDQLWLPARVRRAWADWLRRHRGLSMPCRARSRNASHG